MRWRDRKMNEVAPLAAAAETEPAMSSRAGVGAALVLFSFVLWAPLPVVPFLPIAAVGKTALAGSLFLGTELSFWVGVLLAGPVLVRRLWRWPRLARLARRPLL